MHYAPEYTLSSRRRPHRLAVNASRAFTLIELLVVIAIIAILAAILFPVFAQAREKARQTACLNNEKQISMGMMMYMQDCDGTYPQHYINGVPYTTGGTGPALWTQFIQPYIKNTAVFYCPDDTDHVLFTDSSYNSANYANAPYVSYGLNYWLDYYYYKDATDSAIKSPAQTVWIAEDGTPTSTATISGLGTVPVPGFYLLYPSFYGGAYCSANPGYSGCKTYGFNVPAADARLANRHNGGLNIVWADGHCKWIRRDVLESDVHDDGFGAPTNRGSLYWWGRN